MKFVIYLWLLLFVNLVNAAGPLGNANRIQGRTISATAPTDTQVLAWNATTALWVPSGASAALSTPVALTGGALATPSYTFTGDLDTGMWHSAANTLDFSAGAYLGMSMTKSTGNFANVAYGGGAASTSDIYPIIVSRDQANNTAIAVQNINGDASAGPRFSLISDTGAAAVTDFTLWPAAQTVPAYTSRQTIHTTGTTTGLSIVMTGTTPNDVRYYYNGGTAADEMFRVGNLAATLMNGSALKFNGSTSGTVTVNVGATPTSHTLTLPSAQGAANTVLKNDGSGGLTWAMPTTNTVYTSLANGAYSITVNTWGNLATISLPAGTWALDASVLLYQTGSANAGTLFQTALSNTTAGAGTWGLDRAEISITNVAGDRFNVRLPPQIVTVASTETWYLASSYSGSNITNIQVGGTIRAIRLAP